LKDRVT